MDRRDTIKSLLLGSLAGGALFTACSPEEMSPESVAEAGATEGYGRTPVEAARDAELQSETFFTEAEITLLAVLCDLILPADENFGSATDAGLPEFIEFMAKDIPENQLPLRGGMMWLNHRANRQFGTEFTACSPEQQKSLLDEIALPNEEAPELEAGVLFFAHLRSMVLSGYYTTKTGIEELGYKGNVANIWDGVPEEVLKEHGLSYDEEWLAKCANPNRTEVAKWDEKGNLIS